MQNAPVLQQPAGLTVREALKLEALRQARVVAGRRGLHRSIRWVHIVDIPEITPWLHGGELLLTTGYGWPRDPVVQRRTIRELDRLSLAGILFETGKFIDRVPATVRREADRLGLPILEAPYEVKFVDITEAVHREILSRQHTRLAQLEQIHRALTRAAVEAENLQEIADTLSELIGKPVTIEDAEFRLLAYTDVGGLKDSARMETIRQTRTPQRVLQALDRMGMLKRMHETNGPLRIPPIPDAGMEARVVCPIRTARETLGYVWILEGQQPVSELDMQAAEEIATVAALHILRQQAVASVESRVRHTFVDALLRGEFHRSPALRERAQLMGFDHQGDYAVGVLTIAPSSQRGRRWALAGRKEFELRERYGRALRSSLESLNLPQFTTFLLNQIVFLLPAAAGMPRVRFCVDKLWESVRAQDPDTHLVLTVGGIHRGAEGVAQSYWEADTLVEVVYPMGGIFFYDDHVLARLLHRADRALLRKLQQDTLGRLGDTNDRSALQTTLLALLSNEFNIGATARALNLHRNTVRQRLERIRQASTVSLRDPKFWAQLVLTCEAEKYGLLTEEAAPPSSRPA
ncbi:MAG: PucR family transcriptional regulator ligand-binding domain-containing protein [Armatimonadota bacterium]|nr:PucR family transcriptional regulator ligand-binding domain-containing protein [Armatimonadota bacterium]MDR7470119.1 PucR family transcriptional regulator ligand-binding domain-containing protein [Armatimonadota bacterium]